MKDNNIIKLKELGGTLLKKERIDNTTYIEFSINGFVFRRSGGNFIRFHRTFMNSVECLEKHGCKYIEVVGINKNDCPIIKIKDRFGFVGEIDMASHKYYIKTNDKLSKLCSKNNHKILSFCKNVESEVLIDFNCGHKPQSIVVNYYYNDNKCRVCNNKLVEQGYNDIATTHPNVLKYLKNINDGYKYTYGSGVKVDCLCPCCGFSLKKEINDLTTRGFNCPICTDGLSIGEKLMYSILINSNINFKIHKAFDWSNRKEYDFYLEEYETIIEIHGSQHYNGSFASIGGRSIEEEIENDLYKEKLAKDNGIINYIVIDAKKSNFDFIESNITDSYLSKIIDFETIDWVSVYNDATSSLMEKVWKIKNKNNKLTTTEISHEINLSQATIREWLKIGNRLNMCSYNPHDELCDSINRNAETNKRIVLVYNREGVFEGEYESATYIEQNSIDIFGEFLYSSEIRRVCNGVKKSYKGFVFRYKYNYEYEPKVNIKKSKRIELYKDNILVKVYNSCQELSRNSLKDVGIKLQAGKISEVCNGKRIQHKGFTAKYI